MTIPIFLADIFFILYIMEGENDYKGFNYANTEIKQMGGMKIVRKVSIKRGKGYKSITK